MHESLYLIYLATGFTVGISHCIGMCGPIAVAISMGRKNQSVILPLSLYHIGRVLTYTLLGGAMGFAGSFTRVAEFLLNFQHIILIATGVLIVFMGLAMVGVISKIGFLSKDYSGSEFITKRFKQLVNSNHTVSYLPMGLLLGFLPCGPVYVALTAAAGSGIGADPLYGMLSGMGIMACFGLGTVPALFVLGKISSLKMVQSRQTIYRFAGILVILSGGYFIWRGIL